ncbi:unnamed protein product [Closterium sp. Yama58-4]|nr:unnamed protein product [Closterium sp. Yama58-4]
MHHNRLVACISSSLHPMPSHLLQFPPTSSHPLPPPSTPSHLLPPGGALVVLQTVPDIKRLGLLQGFASGLMLSLTFFDLVPEAIEAIGFPAANLWFFAGALLFATVVHFVPEPSLAPEPSVTPEPSSEPLLKYASDPVSEPTSEPVSEPTLHNFPEGIAVFLGSMKGLRVGISLAVAIALHNIPEGLAVALPIYFGTRSRWAAFRAAALSGAAEPLGVIFVALFFPASLAPDLIEGLLAGVGGIMAFLVLHEMLPLAFEYAGHRRAVLAMFLGMAVMSANLHLLALSLPPDISL